MTIRLLTSVAARPGLLIKTFTTRTPLNMGVTKKLISEGNGVDKPKKGDTITMEYTGNLYDPNAANSKGSQ